MLVLAVVGFIVLEIVFFAVMITVFRKVMTKNVVSATKHLEEMNAEIAKKEEELARKQQSVQQSEGEILRRAREDAEKTREEIIKRAEAERDSIVSQAREHADGIVQQADKSRQQLLGELDERVSREASHKACELIGEALPDDFKQAVHARWVEELIAHGFHQFERLHLPDGESVAKVSSAFALTAAQKEAVSLKLAEVAKRPFKLEESVDPAIVTGFVITIGSLVLDGSLLNRIQKKAR